MVRLPVGGHKRGVACSVGQLDKSLPFGVSCKFDFTTSPYILGHFQIDPYSLVVVNLINVNISHCQFDSY